MKTVFLRVLDSPPDQKATDLLAEIAEQTSSKGARFVVNSQEFSSVPRSPFAYWIGDAFRKIFHSFPKFESHERTATRGASTCDDFRYVRLWFEASQRRQKHLRWPPFTKGGRFARFYADIPTVVDWDASRSTFRGFIGRPGRWLERPEAADKYFSPGITWPLRGIVFSGQAVARGSVFSVGGKVALVPERELLAYLALFNSNAFDALIRVFAGKVGGVQYEVGLLQNLPVPASEIRRSASLASIASRGWSLQRSVDARVEISHAFTLPALLQVGRGSLVGRADAWVQVTRDVQAELDELATQNDDYVYRLYGISADDRRRIEQGFGSTGGDEEADTADGGSDVHEEDDEAAEVDATPMVASLLSWSLGVAFGRFDVRLATGVRLPPPEPEPFDQLPVCSPGMLTGGDFLSVQAPPPDYPLSFPTDGILVDDPGHPRDVVRAARSVFETVFDDANARWHEAAELLGTSNLRTWFARAFFQQHIRRYSKSRRKAPIYWQLATSSGSYSVWIYIHRATGDTVFRVLNDFVGPKLDHEKAKLDRMSREGGGNPSAAQRSELATQEGFVVELQALKAEVARVAPLWRPNLDDGVILNFAPLWRLVPQSRSWQSECKKAWDKLVSGDYDWAHLAMHLWPERVVPKCMNDRSLAIAHGLEDVFWHEDDSGAWRKSQVDDATVQKLTADRTSSTVKAALKDLLSAPSPSVGKGRKPKSRSAAPRRAAPRPSASAPRPSTPDTAVDAAILDTVKAAIARLADGASKADVLAATGLSDADWNKTIAVLLDRGDVSRTGQKRGTRYHAGSQGEGE